MTNQEAIKILNNELNTPFCTEEWLKALDLAIKALEGAECKWIPVTYRQMTEEEVKEACEKWGVKEDVLEYTDKIIFTCPLPEDCQDILVCHGGIVTEDVCTWDQDFCGLEYWGDWIGIDAWMPTPDPYKKGET